MRRPRLVPNIYLRLNGPEKLFGICVENSILSGSPVGSNVGADVDGNRVFENFRGVNFAGGNAEHLVVGENDIAIRQMKKPSTFEKVDDFFGVVRMSLSYLTLIYFQPSDAD